jgi:site-specific DNA-methyltransferase (adenine-specific)
MTTMREKRVRGDVKAATEKTALLVHGDNLPFLTTQPPGIADLIVTDPPFATGRVRVGPSGKAAPHLPRARFEDRWASVEAYLDFLRPRLVAMHALLKPRGALVIHLDYRVAHDVRRELDSIFGRDRFVNEIIWHYTGGGRAKGHFSRKHDNLLWYAKGRRWTFNIDAVRVPYKPGSGYARGGIVSRSGKRYLPNPQGTPIDDVWDIAIVNPLSPERCGYPTQKPERLLERLVLALSAPGELIVDPFCGSGTALVVAARLGRRWIGCDLSAQAIAATRKRLDACGLCGHYAVTRLGSRPAAARVRPRARSSDRSALPGS